MSNALIITNVALLAPLAAVITYYDVRYRRIPNLSVLATLISGLTVNFIFSGVSGVMLSLSGGLLAFSLLVLFHVCGLMGAGDVKLFAAVGSLVGVKLVVPTLFVVCLLGGVLAVYSMLRSGYSMLRSGTVRHMMRDARQLVLGMLPGLNVGRFAPATDYRHNTIPYGVAITLGSLLSIAIFHG